MLPQLRTLLVGENRIVPLLWCPQQVLHKGRATAPVLVVKQFHARFPAIVRLVETVVVGAEKTGGFTSISSPKETLRFSVRAR